MTQTNTLNWTQYLQLFEDILAGENNQAPYDKEAYLNYVKLNHSRQERWLKKGVINEDLKALVAQITEPQTWKVITEPWCGDAAHNVPFWYMISQLNTNINFEIILRDTPPFLIDDYLTNGGKSIPKVIVQNEAGEDLFTWGPRPKEAQEIQLRFKTNNTPIEDQKIILQQWYNKNKGQDLQKEIQDLLEHILTINVNK